MTIPDDIGVGDTDRCTNAQWSEQLQYRDIKHRCRSSQHNIDSAKPWCLEH